ncbi:MAG: lipopolysaccharide export system protein LptC [Thiomicrorhabdus sp.]|nr:MAG: lipopolysaccharide export system protein LptC [Thiomicrorhabdus sp.]
MRLHLSRVRLVIYAFLLSFAALWFNAQQSRSTQAGKSQAKTNQTYSWQSKDSTTWQIDRRNPEQQTTIQTESWRYQESTKQSEFTQPIITLVNLNSTTIITSEKGQSQNDNIISLSGNVIVTQHSDSTEVNQRQLSTLSTQQITYNASQGEISSRDTITITQPSGVTTGIGLEANLKSGYYHLLSDVKGTYHVKNQ